MKKPIVFSVLALLFLMSYATYSSAMMIPMSTEELTLNSDAVITGTVRDIKSGWSADGRAIVTTVTIAVGEVVRGKVQGKLIIVEHLGGTVGDIGLTVSDTPNFNVGEKVLIFIKNEPSRLGGSAYHVYGSAQGKYSIAGDGTATKGGFQVYGDKGHILNGAPVGDLIDLIKGVK